MQAHYDVVILGGGLAGLTLARQLRQERSSLRVLVLEKRAHPAPEAAHKVGESSVEIGAHYFGHVLGLDPHMADRQLPKFGIRYFSTTARTATCAHRYELGPRRFPRVKSYQLDRGRLENFLFEEDQRQGCDVLDRAITTDVVLGDPHHTVHFTQAGCIAPRDLPLGRRCHRPPRLPQGQVRPAASEPAQGQRDVVACRQAAEAR